MDCDDPFFIKTDEDNINPWDVTSLYQFQYYCCPQCVFQAGTKQDFVNHVHDFHVEAEEYLRKIEDGSLSDVFCPWNTDIQGYIFIRLNMLRSMFLSFRL